jgi:aminoglycoside phosphotransferase (APT) family kinase protein
VTAALPIDFEPGALQRFLRAALPELDGAMRLERIAGGQSNPTYFVSFETGRQLVLRKQPGGQLLPSAHAIDREIRNLRALARTGVPVPAALLFCEDRSVVGTPFYVMERVDGRVLTDHALADVAPHERREHLLGMARTLARLHSVDWQAQGLEGFGRTGDYYRRQVARWSRQWAASKAQDNPDVDALIEWLEANVPEEDGLTTIVHGDYRLGNLMYQTDAPQVAAVLDWELATLGHPAADLAHSAMAWLTLPDEFAGLQGIDLPAQGLPSRDEYLAEYRRAGGPDFALTPFHHAFALFRFAAILEGVAARGRAGNASSGNATHVGALAARYARYGLREAGVERSDPLRENIA